MSTRKIARVTAYSVLIGVALAWVMNEITYHFLRSDSARPPATIELVIPAGTAERVSHGESEVSIPKGMVFVVGDIFMIKNEDVSAHQLGPLFIPPGSSAVMTFDAAESYAYACSFAPDRSFGMDVQLPVTFLTRLTGAIFAGLPLGVLIALYGVAVRSSAPSANAG